MYHILYFLDYGQFFGGAVRTLLKQAILMKNAKHKITIIVSDYIDKKMGEEYLEICMANKVDLFQLTYPISYQPEDLDIVSVIQNYDSVKTKIIELQPDIIHSVQVNPIVELICRELQIPHVMNIYQLIPQFFDINYIDVFPHYHICDSEYFAEKWNCYLGTASVCIRTVADKIEDGRRTFTKNEFLKFVCVGTVMKRKNQLEVIKAFHKALKEGIQGCLSIYGYDKGDYAEECKKYILQEKIEKNVLFKGFCPDMCVEYQKYDILICGSKMESYPNVVSEALANGLVIISTPVAGVPEVIKDYYNGYLCEGYTKDDIFNKIKEFNLERMQGKIDCLLEHAYDTFENCHSSSVITNELLTYYDRLVKNYHRYYNIYFEDIRKEFSVIISKYQKCIDLYSAPEVVRQKVWYIYHIYNMVSEKILTGDNKVYIWGTGKFGKIVKEIIETFWENIELSGYLDSYKIGYFEGHKICNPSEILCQSNILVFIAAVNGQNEMIEQLEENQKKYLKDYFILSRRAWG